MKENIISAMLRALEKDYFEYNTQVEYLTNGVYSVKSNEGIYLISDNELIEIFENYPPDMQQELLENYGD